ncbi:acyltransferase [Pedobacter petrophilus]|uniref:Acyltransferase n=1 Tax=Pedobacter petrophilus TaxID=1908241 RepID=A0A7K0G4P5_9SPHI|nr:DapH/DapD/GlmU-related protein [Pedobacter petrophilus]MRX78209.1 acyltransferase [Pedobacter petrophilus]
MHKYISKFKVLWYYLSLHWYYILVFAKIGKNARIQKLLRLECPEHIFIGDDVNIGANSWLAANPLTGQTDCNLIIGNRTYIGNFAHIYCIGKITIGENVLIADKVYISDNLHRYEDVNIAILDQSVKQLKNVLIGDGSWIGENVCIIGANVGRNCVIGANSVVTKDIPDFCVAVGSPAKVIKRFNTEMGIWEKVNKNN